jgi:cation diffusion facilitator family transporter
MRIPEARLQKRAIIISLSVSISILGVKFLAYGLTGSTAILSDALESIINVVASGFALYSLVLSARPPDESHPYGHGKIEFFSAGFEGALIVLAAVVILYKALPQLLAPSPLTQLNLGLLLVAGAGVANLLLGNFLVRTGRRTSSLALIADGKHVLTDVYTSFGVVGSLVLVWLTGWMVLDPVVACTVAMYILVSGTRLMRQSFGRLMDEADVGVLKTIVEALQACRRSAWIDLHHLRSWRSGDFHHIDFHLTLPRYWELDQCHEAEKEVEKVILQRMGRKGEVIVHLDPCVRECCRYCWVRECPVRSAEPDVTLVWTVESATDEPKYHYLGKSPGKTAA